MYTANVVDIRRATEAGAPVLASRRLPRRATIACALVCALAAPAVSSAEDGRALSSTSSLAGTTSTSQDGRGMDLLVGVSTSSLAGTTSTSQDRRGMDRTVGVSTSSLAGTTSAPSQDLRGIDLPVRVSTSSLAGTTSAPSQDLRGIDLPVRVSTSSLAGTTSAPSQDLRAPDNRVPAVGHGTLGDPDVTVVKLSQSAPARGNPGVDRGGSSIAAAIILGVLVFGLAGAAAIAQRRRGGPRTVTAA